MKRDYEQVFQDATSLLIKNHPFFGHILANMVRIHNDNIQTMSVTMNAHSQIVLEYSTKMIQREIEENDATLKNISAMVQHEVYHVINEHFIRGANLKLDRYVMTPLGPKKLFPLSADIAINQYIDNLPPWVLGLNSFEGLDLPKEQAAEIYYKKLLKLAKQNAEEYKDQLNQLGQSTGVLFYKMPNKEGQQQEGPSGMPNPNQPPCPHCKGTGTIKRCPSCGQEVSDQQQRTDDTKESDTSKGETQQDGAQSQNKSGETEKKQGEGSGDQKKQNGQQSKNQSETQQGSDGKTKDEQPQSGSQQATQSTKESKQQPSQKASDGLTKNQQSQQGPAQQGQGQQGQPQQGQQSDTGKSQQGKTTDTEQTDSTQTCPTCGQQIPGDGNSKTQQGEGSGEKNKSEQQGQGQQGQPQQGQQSDTRQNQQGKAQQSTGNQGQPQQGQGQKSPYAQPCPSCNGTGKADMNPRGGIQDQLNAINNWLPFDKEAFEKFMEKLLKEGKTPTSKQSGMPGNHAKWGDARQIPRELVDATVKQAVREAYQKAKYGGQGIGNLPAGIERMCKETLKPAYNFAPFLKRFIDGELYSRAIPTRKRPNRRYRWEYPGRKTETKGKIGLLVDSSGSIYDKDIALFIKNIEQMSEYAEIIVFDVDTAIHDVRKYNKRQFKKAIKGGGGTQFGDVFKILENFHENKQRLAKVPENHRRMARQYIAGIKALIIMTDGMVMDVPKKQPNIPVMWALTNKAYEAPRKWGKVIYLDNKPEDHGDWRR